MQYENPMKKRGIIIYRPSEKRGKQLMEFWTSTQYKKLLANVKLRLGRQSGPNNHNMARGPNNQRERVRATGPG
jgi:hypothetical protein